MGSVVYFEESAVDWLEIPDAWEGKVAKGEPDVRYKLLTAGGDGVPGIQFVEFDAGHHEQAHSHAESEVLWVQSGEVTIGGHTLRAGSGAFIEIQGTAESSPFSQSTLDKMLALAARGIDDIVRCQREILDE